MDKQTKQYQHVIAKCWADHAFKQRLIADPAGTLKGEGIEIPQGISVKVWENTQNIEHIVIPERPSALSDEQLAGTAGGMTWCIEDGHLCYWCWS